MQTIAIHGRDYHPHIRRFGDGCVAAGYAVHYRRPMSGCLNALPDVVAAVIFPELGTVEALVPQYVGLGIPVWIHELARLRASAGEDQNHAAVCHGLYRETLHYVPDYVANTAVVYGRIADRQPLEVLVCGQKPGDRQHGLDGAAMQAWARATIAAARAAYGLPVTYRPHPRTSHGIDLTHGADKLSHPRDETLRDAMARAALVVTINSTSGIEAIDAGVPAVYTAAPEDCAWAPWGVPLGDAPRVLSEAERRECLGRFAACTWTADQLASGEAQRVIFSGAAPRPFALVELNAGLPALAPTVTAEAVSTAEAPPTPRKRGRPRKAAL
jgi:hypothetical protein